jgi:hypothetical protein
MRSVTPSRLVSRLLSSPSNPHRPKCPDLESNQDQGLRRALCDPLHYRDTFPFQSRRLDLHQHDAVYRTAALLFGHIGFFRSSTSARIRTPYDGFGDRLLSQEHVRVSAPGHTAEGLWRSDYSRRVTFQ